MNLEGWMSMGGHAPYVWGAVAVCLGVMAAEVAALRTRLRAARLAVVAACEGADTPQRSGGPA